MTLDEIMTHIDTSGDAFLFEVAGHIRTLQGQLERVPIQEREAFQKGYRRAVKDIDEDLTGQALHPYDPKIDKDTVVGILQHARERLKLRAAPEKE